MPYVSSIERVLERKMAARFRDEGKQEGTLTIILRLLNKRFGPLGTEMEQQISQLDIAGLNDLSDSLLDFTTKDDLIKWLSAVSSQ